MKVSHALVASLALALGMAATKAEAHPYHTPTLCAEGAPSVCAHLGFAAQPDATQATEFMLHFMPKDGVTGKEIQNVTVTLWMDMDGNGHGSSPVTITPGNDVHYNVSDVYFLMPGAWQVKVGFSFNGATHEIVIPVEVK